MIIHTDAIENAITILKKSNESTVSSALESILKMSKSQFNEIDLVDNKSMAFRSPTTWHDIEVEIEAMGFPPKSQHVYGVIEHIRNNYYPYYPEEKETVIREAITSYFAEREERHLFI